MLGSSPVCLTIDYRRLASVILTAKAASKWKQRAKTVRRASPFFRPSRQGCFGNATAREPGVELEVELGGKAK